MAETVEASGRSEVLDAAGGERVQSFPITGMPAGEAAFTPNGRHVYVVEESQRSAFATRAASFTCSTPTPGPSSARASGSGGSFPPP
jgi:DNA-binding beta-propeller fold protein YncE